MAFPVNNKEAVTCHLPQKSLQTRGPGMKTNKQHTSLEKVMSKAKILTHEQILGLSAPFATTFIRSSFARSWTNGSNISILHCSTLLNSC